MAKRPKPVKERPIRNDLQGIAGADGHGRGMLRMADQSPQVNCRLSHQLSYENRTTLLQTPSAKDCVLMQEPASPAEERRELVRIDDNIKDKRYRGQHEHQVS